VSREVRSIVEQWGLLENSLLGGVLSQAREKTAIGGDDRPREKKKRPYFTGGKKGRKRGKLQAS